MLSKGNLTYLDRERFPFIVGGGGNETQVMQVEILARCSRLPAASAWSSRKKAAIG